MIVTAGSTNVSVYYYIVQDASATSPGEPVTGLLFSDIETGGSASFVRQGAARVDLTLITLASASATHADGGFILVDDTNMPGLYRCDYPDAAFVTGVDQVFTQIVVASANNAVAAPILVDLTDVDLRDSVRAGLTALPNAAADAAGGLPISDAGGLDLDGRLDADVSSRLAPTTASRTLDVTAAGNAGIDWANVENPTTALNLSSTNIDVDQVVASVSGAVGSVTGAVGSVTGSVGSVAGNVDGSTASVTGAVGSVTGAVGSVTGSVGSVAGNVDGNVTGSVGSVVGDTAQTGDNFARLGAPAGASVSADIAALEADAIQKNAAYSNFEFLMVLTSDHVTPATGLTVTGERSIDGGAFSAVSGTIAEVSNGIYQFDALAADTNGDVITWRFLSATADDTFVTFNTST